jgi:hypothetical protein
LRGQPRVSKKSVYPSALRYFNAEGVVEQRPGLAAFFAANPGISVRKPATLKGLRTELGTQSFQGWAVGTAATQGWVVVLPHVARRKRGGFPTSPDFFDTLATARNPQSEDAECVQTQDFVAAAALQGFGDLGIAGDGLPDFQVVASQVLLFRNQDFRVASDLLGAVLVEGGKGTTGAGDLSKGEAQFNSAETILEQGASGLVSVPVSAENHCF